MDVSTDGDWCLNGLAVGFFNEDLLNLFADESQVTLCKDFAVLDGLQTLIDVHIKKFLLL